MAIKTAVAETEGGPDGQGVWQQTYMSIRVPAATIGTSTANVVIGVVPQPDLALAGAQPNPQGLPAGNAIMRVVGAQVATDANLATESTLDLQVLVLNSSAAEIGGAFAFGWATSGSGTPAFTAFESKKLPANPSNSAFHGLLQSGIPVLPGDVIALLLKTSSSTVSWPGGVVAIELT